MKANLKYIIRKKGELKMNINVLKVQILMGKSEMTINQLAEKCHVSRQTISNMTVRRSCSPITACKIATALGVDMEEIVSE